GQASKRRDEACPHRARACVPMARLSAGAATRAAKPRRTLQSRRDAEPSRSRRRRPGTLDRMTIDLDAARAPLTVLSEDESMFRDAVSAFADEQVRPRVQA